MLKSRKQRRRHESTSTSEDTNRLDPIPEPSKSVTEMLQKLLDTVVALTNTVTSAVDFYKQNHQPSDWQLSSPSDAKKSSPTIATPSSETNVDCQRKRRRSTVSTTDNDDDDFVSHMDDDTLTCVFIPGEHQLMYVQEDKNLYVRRYSFQNYDRYVCKAPHCQCTVQLTKPSGTARRVGNRTATHEHANMEREYAEITNNYNTTQAVTSGTTVDINTIRLLESDKSTPIRRVQSPEPKLATGSSGIKTEIEVADEHVWAEMLAIEEGNEVSDIDEATFQDSHVDKSTRFGNASKCEDHQGDSEHNENMLFEFITGKRLHSTLLYTLDEKHMYRRLSHNLTYDRYVCISNVCRVCVRYYKEEKAVRRGNSKLRKHNHPNAEERYHANKFLNGVKQDILSAGSAFSAVQIYETHAEKNAQIAQIVPFGQKKNTLLKFKSRNQLRNQFDSPVTLAGVAAEFQKATIFETFGRCRTSSGEPSGDFYRGTVDEPTFGFTVFASATVVQHVSQSPAGGRHFHVDGTADFLPNGEFKELLMVYWEHKDFVFPVVYALLTKRSKAAYIALFQYIEERICQLTPASITCDYEFPLRNGLRRVYPNCIRRPSLFNLVQAARRYAVSLPQFFETMNADASQCRVYHKLMHLPVLPPDQMEHGFELARAETSTFGLAFKQLVDYVYMTWIAGPDGPMSVIGSESKSSKLVETYIAGMRTKFRSGRKFFHFVDDLAKDELNKVEQLHKLTAGTIVIDSNKPKGIGIRHWHNIAKMQRKLQDGDISVGDFLQKLTNNTSALHMSSESHQFGSQPTDSAIDEAEDADVMEKEIDWSLCVRCGAEERQKIVLQPCGHVCHRCYETRSSSRKMVCPECNAIVKGTIVF